jgi:transcriptional regulator with XRE-family HTH domain
MVNAPPTLGRRIADLRERKGWTQKQLAERAGLSVPFLSDVERDKRNIGSEALLRIADALRASLEYLMRGEDQQEVEPRKPLTIPAELAMAAKEQGWSYADTSDLVELQKIVVARRGGPRARREWNKEDWINLRERLLAHEETED